MAVNLSSVYQSGQKVPATGTYEVVGATRPRSAYEREGLIHTLNEGEVFPGHEGFDVCWHLESAEHVQKVQRADSKS